MFKLHRDNKEALLNANVILTFVIYMQVRQQQQIHHLKNNFARVTCCGQSVIFFLLFCYRSHVLIARKI